MQSWHWWRLGGSGTIYQYLGSITITITIPAVAAPYKFEIPLGDETIDNGFLITLSWIAEGEERVVLNSRSIKPICEPLR